MKLYKGRIPESPAPLMNAINRSLPVDIRLWPYDLMTNHAWASALTEVGVFSVEECSQVQRILEELAQLEPADFNPLPEDEDVHTLVERLLTERLGDTGARIHTGRSRNDQVVCDLRLFARDKLDDLQHLVKTAILLISDQARVHKDTLMAGTTHLQPALPVSLGHFLLSACFALLRDLDRLKDARRRTNLCPLGSGAMAGSGFAVDRHRLAKDLGFDAPLLNSIDAVSDRDFCAEIAFACSQIAVHLSRYAEQFIFWANPAFGYVRFADAWSTGSSMMPQKRNPDAMELIRGKTARVIAACTQLLTVMKGLPLTYAKDLQEDKLPLFEALDTTCLMVEVFGQAVSTAVFQKQNLARGLSPDMLATDLADVLARAGVPFRKAHERVGLLVSTLETGGRTLKMLSAKDFQKLFPELQNALPDLSYVASLSQRNVLGGTAPPRVEEQLELLVELLKAKT